MKVNESILVQRSVIWDVLSALSDRQTLPAQPKKKIYHFIFLKTPSYGRRLYQLCLFMLCVCADQAAIWHGYTFAWATCFFFVWWYRVSEHFLAANVYLDFTIWASSSLHKVKILSSNPPPGCVSLFLINMFSVPTVTSIFTAVSIVFIWYQSSRDMPTWRAKTVWRPFESL